MNCYRCHTPLPDEARFCISCGADLSDPTGAGASSTAAMDAARAAQLLRMVQEEVGAEYEVERELGRGGMAVVYLATEINLGRKVAIKVLPPELTFGTGVIERFKREARTAATLDHPNIIPIYRISTGGALFWYAMKYLQGRSLADILKEHKRLSLSDAIKVLEQVAHALDYAHARDVIHRDIKPANVMLDAQKRVIVTDFGIAKQLAAGSFTASGSVIGTPYYMSPEQCSGSKTLSGAADQYSAGVMAYEMLAGQVPFEGDSAVDILTKHVMQPPPPLEVLRPGLPKYVYAAIEKALAKKPEDRFATVGDFVEALRGAGQATIAEPRRRSLWREAPTAPVPRKPTRRWIRTVTVAALGGAAMGGAALWILSQRSIVRTETGAATGAATAATAQARSAEAPPDTSGTPREQETARSAAGTAAQRAEPVTPPAAEPQPSRGRLAVVGLPPRGTVFINGQRRSGSNFELEPGTYTVRVEAPGFVTTQTTIQVGAGRLSQLALTPVRVQQPPQRGDTARAETAEAARPAGPAGERPQAPGPAPGTLVVRVNGGWAKIYLDGVEKRQGTNYREALPAGTHRLRLEREGYVTVDTTITLAPGQTQIVTIPMRRVGS